MGTSDEVHTGHLGARAWCEQSKVCITGDRDAEGAFSFRLHEFDEQVAAVREGMARVVPVPLLSLFTGYELETMVCQPQRAAALELLFVL